MRGDDVVIYTFTPPVRRLGLTPIECQQVVDGIKYKNTTHKHCSTQRASRCTKHHLLLAHRSVIFLIRVRRGAVRCDAVRIETGTHRIASRLRNNYEQTGNYFSRLCALARIARLLACCIDDDATQTYKPRATMETTTTTHNRPGGRPSGALRSARNRNHDDATFPTPQRERRPHPERASCCRLYRRRFNVAFETPRVENGNFPRKRLSDVARWTDGWMDECRTYGIRIIP